MQRIIDFAYTGSVSVTEDNIWELLQAADQFLITGIERACCNFLLEGVSPENCIEIWQLCNICLDPGVKQKSYCYLHILFEEVVLREELQQLSVQELSVILDSDELRVRQEETLCEAIFKWVEYEPAQRQQHFTVLLSKVRLALTSQGYIAQLMSTEAVSSNAECVEIVQHAKKLKTAMSKWTPSLSVCSNRAARPRLPNAILFAVGNSNTNLAEVYDFQADRWNIISNRGLCHVTCHGIVHCNGSIYCFTCGDKNVMYRFDLTTQIWHEEAKMGCRRCSVCVTVLDGFIYVIGGHYKGLQTFTLKSAKRYDPRTKKSRFIAFMHESRTGASCTGLHNMIYICGGSNGRHSLDTCECYSPAINQWTHFSSMRTQRCGLGVIAYDNLIFAVGGTMSGMALKSVEAYDPQTDTWKEVTPMLTNRNDFGIAVIDNRLFVVGGSEFSESSVECYDKSTKLWSEVCQMEAPRVNPRCCVVSGLPNVAEYVISRDKLRRLDEEEGLVES